MRYFEILKEYHFNPIPDDLTQKAESLGFDTSKIWFHGSNRKFKSFKMIDRKNNINELGRGIYLTGHWSTAIAFGSLIYDCYIKKGPIYDRNVRPTDDMIEKMYQIYKQNDNINPRYQEFEPFKYDLGIKYHTFVSNQMIEGLGYIGAVDHYSQISDQIVVFDPANVFIGSMNPAGEWGDRR